jgi:hypothetical protein
MLAQDIAELNQLAIDLFASDLAEIPLFVVDSDHGEPDETAPWCRFAVNPDQNKITTIGQNNRFLQEGSAVLQIMQPHNYVPGNNDLNAWEIADKATQVFRSFRGSDGRININNVIPQQASTSDLNNQASGLVSISNDEA